MRWTEACGLQSDWRQWLAKVARLHVYTLLSGWCGVQYPLQGDGISQCVLFDLSLLTSQTNLNGKGPGGDEDLATPVKQNLIVLGFGSWHIWGKLKLYLNTEFVII